jgi:hypothetical protein
LEKYIRQYLHWIMLGFAWLLAFGLGINGFAEYAEIHSVPYSFLDNLYLTFQLIILDSGGVEPPISLSLNLARFLLPLLAGTTALKAFWNVVNQEIHSAKLSRLRGHIIICGLSHKGFLLSNQFKERGFQTVVIERDEQNSYLEACRQLQMFVLVGNASDSALLGAAGVENAQGIFAVCDDDGLNIEIALRSQEIVKARRGEPLSCLVHVSDPKLCVLLREHEASLEEVPFRLAMFNVFERGARRLLQQYPGWVAGAGANGSPPKIVIVGLGRLGENLLLHVARDWWNQTKDKSCRLRVSIIDRNANHRVDSLATRYPHLRSACSLVPLPMEIDSAEFEQAKYLYGEDNKLDTRIIYICLDHDSLGLHAGLTLSRQIHNDSVAIIVRMADDTGLAKLLQNQTNLGMVYRNLYGFGILKHTCTPELLNTTLRDTLARAAHEEYVAKQQREGKTINNDPAMKPWEQLSKQYQRSNYQWVDRISKQIKNSGYRIVPLVDWDAPSFQFTADEVEKMAQIEHEEWMQQHLQDGWVYKDQPKNLQKKTNPNMVPWQDLPVCKKGKNFSSVAGIPRFLAQAGFQLEKVTVSKNSTW